MENPATPGAQAPATPGNGQANGQQPPATPPAQQQPAQPADTVTLKAEEHKQLLRDQARLRSLQRRGLRQPAPTAGGEGHDPNDQVAEVMNENSGLKQQLLQRDVKDNVRDLLSKPEYANIPESTRKLILKNPSALSEAKDLDGIVSDIEDFLDEEAAAAKAGGGTQQRPPAQQQPQPEAQPQGHETPPKVGAGSPAQPAADQFEDTTHLTGRARSQATFRNVQRRSRGLKE